MKGKIFNAQEVQAILNGSKVMFREVINTKQSFIEPSEPYGKYPYQVGEKIFVKEGFIKAAPLNKWGFPDVFNEKVWFRATDEKPEHLVGDRDWVCATSMKQEHSRLTLLIKEIRVERLGEISEEDCWKEGLDTNADYADWAVRQAVKENQSEVTAKDYFREKWNSTHKKPEKKWHANPFCWVVEFEVINK